MDIQKYNWPPQIPDLGDVVKEYIDSKKPMSIAGRAGVYQELEDKFAKLHGREYALLVSSGTMALYSAYFAIGLKPEDEVICTVYSYHATAAPLLHFGTKIVFCDVEEDTGNIDVSRIEQLITRRTRAIVTNDQWGHPVDKDAILAICRKYELQYVEDCSHAHFSQYKGRYSGTFGDIACWSFQGNKLLSGGEGGILLTDNQDYYERAVLLGHNLKRPFESVKNEKYSGFRRTGFGLKLRIHPLAALIILRQLDNYCFEWIRSRTEMLTYFQEELAKKTPIQPMTRRGYVTSMGAWYGFKPSCDWDARGIDRMDFINAMQQNGLDVDLPGSEPMVNYELFQLESLSPVMHKQNSQTIKDFPGAKKYYDSIISLPTFTFKNNKGTIDEYVSRIADFFSGN